MAPLTEIVFGIQEVLDSETLVAKLSSGFLNFELDNFDQLNLAESDPVLSCNVAIPYSLGPSFLSTMA